MEENRKSQLQREAQARLALQQDRARRLRQRCVTASVVCFALIWGIVFTQLLSGNDPVLGNGGSVVASAAGSRAPTQAETTGDDDGEHEEEGEDEHGAEQLEIEAAEAEAGELEAAELEAAEAEAAEAEEEALTTSPS